MLILTYHHLCSGQAKPSKKTRVSKPAEDHKVVEPEHQVSASDVSEKQPDDPAPDVSPRFWMSVLPTPIITLQTLDHQAHLSRQRLTLMMF